MTTDAIRGSFVTTKARALTRFVVLPALLALATCSTAWAAVNPVLHDEGGFFKEETIQKANEQIGAINRTYHRDLQIDTFKTLPKDKVEAFSKMDGAAKNEFYNTWARDRAKNAAVN